LKPASPALQPKLENAVSVQAFIPASWVLSADLRKMSALSSFATKNPGRIPFVMAENSIRTTLSSLQLPRDYSQSSPKSSSFVIIFSESGEL
jgi:hypothetical protein